MSWRSATPVDRAFRERLQRELQRQRRILTRQKWKGASLTSYDNTEYTSLGTYDDHDLISYDLPPGRHLLFGSATAKFEGTSGLASSGMTFRLRLISAALGEIAEVRLFSLYFDSGYVWSTTAFVDDTLTSDSGDTITLQGQAFGFVGTLETTVFNARLSAIPL